MLLLLLLLACPKTGGPSLGVTLVLTEPGSVEPTRVIEPRLGVSCATALPDRRGLMVTGVEPELEIRLNEERRSASDFDRTIMVRMGDESWTTVGDSSFTVMSVGRSLSGVMHTGVLTADGRRNLAVTFNLPSC